MLVKKPGSQPYSRLRKREKVARRGRGRVFILFFQVLSSFSRGYWLSRIRARAQEPCCLGYRTTNTFFFTWPSSHGMESPLATWYHGPSSRERLLRVQKLHEQASHASTSTYPTLPGAPAEVTIALKICFSPIFTSLGNQESMLFVDFRSILASHPF